MFLPIRDQLNAHLIVEISLLNRGQAYVYGSRFCTCRSVAGRWNCLISDQLWFTESSQAHRFIWKIRSVRTHQITGSYGLPSASWRQQSHVPLFQRFVVLSAIVSNSSRSASASRLQPYYWFQHDPEAFRAQLRVCMVMVCNVCYMGDILVLMRSFSIRGYDGASLSSDSTSWSPTAAE